MMISNMPAGDEWYLQDTDDKSINYEKKFKFCFDQFKAGKIKMLVKSYVWRNYQTGSLTLSSIYKNYSYFNKFNLFAVQNCIDDLAHFDTKDVDEYMTYLRMSKSKFTEKPLSYLTQKEIFTGLRTIVSWGQVFMPKLVPMHEVFIDVGYPGYHAKHKIEYIPDDVVKQINAALLIEENPYIKYGIIILFSTGMRRSELLNLEVGCVTPHLLNGDTLTMYDFKNRRQNRKIPINPVCADAIIKLTEATAEIREKANANIKKYLFIYEGMRRNNVSAISVVSKYMLKEWINGYTSNGRFHPGFVYRHNITGSDGKIYKIKIQQFRKTIATDMFSKNVDLKIIQEFLRHTRPDTTKKYYADDKDIDRAMIFEKVGIIGNINRIDTSIIDDENELAWFIENKDKRAKMCDGYCTMPIVDGEICAKLINHQKCYTCSRYITTPEYLQAHKEHLAELEIQLANNIYGAHYAAHISPTITILKDIIERLEAVRHEC